LLRFLIHWAASDYREHCHHNEPAVNVCVDEQEQPLLEWNCKDYVIERNEMKLMDLRND
jgi:hypothetical protein